MNTRSPKNDEIYIYIYICHWQFQTKSIPPHNPAWLVDYAHWSQPRASRDSATSYCTQSQIIGVNHSDTSYKCIQKQNQTFKKPCSPQLNINFRSFLSDIFQTKKHMLDTHLHPKNRDLGVIFPTKISSGSIAELPQKSYVELDDPWSLFFVPPRLPMWIMWIEKFPNVYTVN